MKWIKKILKFALKNWIPLAFVILFIVLWGDKSCDEAEYKKDIAELNKKIGEKVEDNKKKDDVIKKAVSDAKAAERVVADKEAIIADRDITITDLKRRERICELPVTYKARKKGKKIGMKDGVQATWNLIKWKFKK